MPEALELLQQTNFSTLDWVIVITYPLISLSSALRPQVHRQHE